MEFDIAISLARILAACYRAAIGDCLLSHQILDTQSGDSSWVFCFSILDGPDDWCWFIFVSPGPDRGEVYASNCRPAQVLAPHIERRWGIFGGREILIQSPEPADTSERDFQLAKEMFAARDATARLD
jgi:hypothetical protein